MVKLLECATYRSHSRHWPRNLEELSFLSKQKWRVNDEVTDYGNGFIFYGTTKLFVAFRLLLSKTTRTRWTSTTLSLRLFAASSFVLLVLHFLPRRRLSTIWLGGSNYLYSEMKFLNTSHVSVRQPKCHIMMDDRHQQKSIIFMV